MRPTGTEAVVGRAAERWRCARALLTAFDATDAPEVPIRREVIVDLLALLGVTLDHACPICGGRIVASRQTRGFCRDACRSESYRRRQRLAHQRWAEGVPLAAIAQEVESTPQVVLGWLEKPPPGIGPRHPPRLMPRPGRSDEVAPTHVRQTS